MAIPYEDGRLPAERDTVAPDGSDVRVLGRVARGSMAHFTLGAGEVARAVVHRTVDELWYVLEGVGVMWRRSRDGGASEVEMAPGTSLAIPVGTSFQFRNVGRAPLAVVAVTMPPWPGEGEAVVVEGRWAPTA